MHQPSNSWPKSGDGSGSSSVSTSPSESLISSSFSLSFHILHLSFLSFASFNLCCLISSGDNRDIVSFFLSFSNSSSLFITSILCSILISNQLSASFSFSTSAFFRLLSFSQCSLFSSMKETIHLSISQCLIFFFFFSICWYLVSSLFWISTISSSNSSS